MSSSVVTTRWQSSETGLQIEDCPSTSPSFTSIHIAPRVSTSELQETNTELNNTYRPPHPIDYQPSVNGRRKTRFTLHRLLSAVIPIVFVASKFIDGFHGRALTLGLLDLIPAILVLMLNVFSWFESDPPHYLGWLFDTDWDYLLYMTKQRASFILLLAKLLARSVFLLTRLLARKAKNLFASLGIIFRVYSILLALTSVILLSRNHHPGGYIDFFGFDCLALVLISFVRLMIAGGDRHRRKAYKHAIFMSGNLTQLALLASWTMRLWFPDRPRISTTLFCSSLCLWCITNALGWFTGHLGEPAQAKILILAWSSFILICASIFSIGTLIRLLDFVIIPIFLTS